MMPASADVIAELEGRIRFESYITDCAARLTGARLPADLDDYIEQALRELLGFFHADRCALLGGSPDEHLSWVTCAASGDAADATLGGVDFAAAFPWHFARLCAAAEPLAFVRLADLPAEAEQDRRSAERMGIRSMLALAIRGDGAAPHCLLIQSLRDGGRWPEPYVARLPVLAQVLVNALERQRVEETRQVESRHADVLESVGAILWRAEPRTFQTTFVSREAEAILGYPIESWVRVPGFWRDHVHPDDRAWVEAFSGAAVQERRNHDFEYRMIVADGRTVWLRNIVKVIVADGEPVSLIGVTVDITKRKRAEFEAEQLRHQLTHAGRVTSLGELAATLAHELNQPLGALVSNAEAARMSLDRKKPDATRLRGIVEDIERDAQRAGAIVHRVRALLQKQASEVKPIDAAGLVVAVVGLARPLAQSRQIELATELQPALPSYGDAVQIQQVLLNLILNAMDAVADQPRGRRHVIVRGVHCGSDVRITVSDTGKGIPAEALPHVFDPFFTTRPAGMGMGLAICRSIVEAHGGRIQVENNPAGGAAVHFTLPSGGGRDGDES